MYFAIPILKLNNSQIPKELKKKTYENRQYSKALNWSKQIEIMKPSMIN